MNKGETYTPPPGLGSFEYVGGSPFLDCSVVTIRNKIVRPATDQDQKSLPAYMIYQPKQLEDKIRADLSKGGPSLRRVPNFVRITRTPLSCLEISTMGQRDRSTPS